MDEFFWEYTWPRILYAQDVLRAYRVIGILVVDSESWIIELENGLGVMLEISGHPDWGPQDIYPTVGTLV